MGADACWYVCSVRSRRKLPGCVCVCRARRGDLGCSDDAHTHTPRDHTYNIDCAHRVYTMSRHASLDVSFITPTMRQLFQVRRQSPSKAVEEWEKDAVEWVMSTQDREDVSGEYVSLMAVYPAHSLHGCCV